jgi:hypothetical protein
VWIAAITGLAIVWVVFQQAMAGAPLLGLTLTP